MKLLLALLVLALPAAAQSRLGWARCELVGPMSEPSLELVAGSRTQLHGELLAGEHAERLLPVVLDGLGAHGEPRWSWNGDPDRAGRARFLGWVKDSDERWAALPAGLRSRPRPPVSPADTTPPLALLFVLGACALGTGLLARRSKLAAAAPALAGCALALWIGGANSAGEAQRPILLEGAGESGPWLELRAGWETLVLPADARPLALMTEPETASIALATELSGTGSLEIRATGAALFAARAPDPGPGRLAEDGQDCADFEAVWWRAEGEWSFRGPWRRGEPLPPARPGEAPPGWLANGLPQGPRVCLARTTGPHSRWFRQLGP